MNTLRQSLQKELEKQYFKEYYAKQLTEILTSQMDDLNEKVALQMLAVRLDSIKAAILNLSKKDKPYKHLVISDTKESENTNLITYALRKLSKETQFKNIAKDCVNLIDNIEIQLKAQE